VTMRAPRGEDVGVVVFAGEAGGVYVMGQSGADAGDFVGGDGDADAGAANDNADVRVFCGHSFAYSFAKAGVLHGLFRGRAPIVDSVSGRFEMLPDDFFDEESGVIGADGEARFGWRFAHECQRAGLYRRSAFIAI
jgi:hypothetical protein